MFTSADLIEALRRRMRRSLRPEPPPGTFPPGWAAWFASMRERAGKVTGATADAIIAIFIAREPALPPRATLLLNRWQSFGTLWRQQWHPESRDSRGVRIFALAVTLLVHLMFAVFLVYLAYIRFMAASAPEGARAGEEDVVQVEFIGEGTPQETGGGPPQAQEQAQAADSPAAAAPSAPATPVQRVAREPAAPAPSPQAAPAAPEQPPSQAEPAPAPPVEQPLQVTQTPLPDQAFTLPPVRIVDLPQPDVPTPDLSAPAPEIRVVDIPTPARPVQPVLPRLPTPAIAVPDLERPPAEVVVRDIPAPLSPVRIRNDMPAVPVETPELEAGAPQIVVRDIPAPPAPVGTAQRQSGSATAARPAIGASPATGTAPAPGAATPAPGSQTAQGGTQPDQPASGSGAAPGPRPGALPSPRPGDDWGLSDRNRPGGQAGTPGGLFDADGSPRLAEGAGKVGGGLPPGTITEDFAKIDRHGTWLKRPPTDYEPTSFDKFWLPDETLLEEWVRRSIKQVLIPIPGTSKTITCSVVLLALGGACGIDDPNMQDIEATARKPPDIPFKPELQENPEVLGEP